MTIYAVVNNLLKERASIDDSSPVWTIISGAGILQGGNPYFVPDFANRFEARPALAVKIGKLGKGIAPRFAHRYVDTLAPCILFVATDLLERLRKEGLPWTPALSYDKCIALGKFINIPFDEIGKATISLQLASQDCSTESAWSGKELKPDVADVISALSVDNTLKTGDIIVSGISGEGHMVAPGTKASLSINGAESLKFNIR